MAKKKSSPVVYTPISSYVPPIQDVLADVPLYDDRGVSFKGYAKIAKGNKQYDLKKQDTRFYYFGLTAGSSSSTFTRSDKAQVNHYMRTITFSWRLSADVQISLFDGNANNPRFRLAFPSGTGTLTIPMGDINRPFTNDIIITAITAFAGAPYVLAGAEFVTFCAFGWDEQI